jgi:DHA3 family macrolide efflux protein-like MFS transporter
VVGSLIVSAWGGFKRRMNGFVIGWGLFCIFGMITFALGRDLTVWIPSYLIGCLMIPLANSSSQALLQAKVAPDVQGRVFSARRLLTWAPDMFTPLLGGALADYVMEPAMKSGGGLPRTFGWMVGTGPGSGMSLIIIFFGILCLLSVLMCWIIPVVRNIEDILPDHNQAVEAPPGSSTN